MQKMLVVGGERYRWRFEGLGAQVRYMPFKRDGGDQSLRRVIDALAANQN